MTLQSNNNSLPPEVKKLSLENRNFLSPIGFRFVISRLRGVDFFCQSANIPAVSMSYVDQGTLFNKVPQPGDELTYENLNIRFLVDENMKNWYQVHDWIREITTPYSSKEFKYNRGEISSQNTPPPRGETGEWSNQWRCDCSLFILSSNYRPVAEFVFRDAFPLSLSTLTFDSSVSDIQYFNAECVFKYNYYDYYIYDAAHATDSTMEPTYRRSAEGVELS